MPDDDRPLIAVRTNANGTLGHLARTRHLSVALARHGYATRFLLDHAPPAFDAEWLDALAVTALYADGEAFHNAADDAGRSIAALAALAPVLVIADDYRLAQPWELALSAAGYRLAAIDDLQRDHAVDVLIEPGLRPRGPERLPGSATLHLEGPRFALLDATYYSAGDKRCARRRTVVMSLGGGGKVSLIGALLEHLVPMCAASAAADVLFRPVLGPMATGADALTAVAARYPDQIRVAYAPASLAPLLRDCDLFVGAAGTAIYELAALAVPALSFSIADNQVNRLDDLESIGHYLHCNDYNPEQTSALAACVHELLRQLPRLRALRATAGRCIDGRGAERVASQIHRWLDDRAYDNRTAVPSTSPEQRAPEDVPLAQPGDGVSVYACDDRDINRYLDARNRPNNRGNMTDAREIHRLEHYRWWFTTARESFCVRRNGVPLLYIWHERVTVAGQSVLIGGWFVACDRVDLPAVMLALDWQLEYTDRRFPGLPWVAVIRRSNRFVYHMNQRAGFEDTAVGSPWWHTVGACFPTAPYDEFHYLYRPPPPDRTPRG